MVQSNTKNTDNACPINVLLTQIEEIAIASKLFLFVNIRSHNALTIRGLSRDKTKRTRQHTNKRNLIANMLKVFFKLGRKAWPQMCTMNPTTKATTPSTTTTGLGFMWVNLGR